MQSKLEKLTFTVSLIDKISPQLNAIQARFEKITGTAVNGFRQVGFGAAGLAGAGILLKQALQPAIELGRALDTVETLDVSQGALDKLAATALKFSVQYGESADAFIRSAFDIQSAIAGLNGTELSRFTEVSGVLAKATQSDAATITDFMGTMFGIFQKEANRIGRSKWAEKLAGQTATAVKLFKTTGTDMAAAFSNLGAEATSANIGMAEQITILGTLQATMSGSEAGTKYKAFLAGIGKAQDVLGLKFTDSQGKLLPMTNILQTLQNKFGDLDTVAESDLLKKAFGAKEAVSLVKLLSQDIDGLGRNITAIGSNTGMQQATKMAEAMIDPYERLDAGIKAVRIVFGRVLLPVLKPVIDRLTQGAEILVRWSELFPNLTRVIGFSVLAVIGLIAAVSLFTLTMGLGRLVISGFRIMMLLWDATIWLVRGSLLALRVAGLIGLIVSLLSVSAAITVVKSVMLIWQGVIWLVNAALLANPITLIILGIAALIAAVIAVVVYWDELMEVFSNFSIFNALGSAIDWLIDKINLIPGIDIGGDTEINQTIKTSNEIGTISTRSTGKLSTLPLGQLPFAANTPLSLLSRVNEQADNNKQALNFTLPGLQPAQANVSAGGIIRQVNKTSSETRATRIDNVNINTNSPVDAQSLDGLLMMAAP